MEETVEGLSLLDGVIRPPRLEDAGLEDCALSLEAIREAFLKAAKSVADEEEEDDRRSCVQDPTPTDDVYAPPESLLGEHDERPPAGPLCGGIVEKGGSPEQHGPSPEDLMAGKGSVEGELPLDEILNPGSGSDEAGEKPCVVGDGEDFVYGGEKQKKDSVDEEVDDEEPTLVEALI